jgi:hypothetical protein
MKQPPEKLNCGNAAKIFNKFMKEGLPGGKKYKKRPV